MGFLKRRNTFVQIDSTSKILIFCWWNPDWLNFTEQRTTRTIDDITDCFAQSVDLQHRLTLKAWFTILEQSPSRYNLTSISDIL